MVHRGHAVDEQARGRPEDDVAEQLRLGLREPSREVAPGDLLVHRVRSDVLVEVVGGLLAVAVAAQWISNFLVSATFPSLSAWSVGGTYCIYALMALASALFVWKWVPETKGRTLEEMSKLWRKNGD